MKRLTAIILILTLLLCSAALADDGPLYRMAGYESDTSRDWKTNAFFARMQEKTGISWEMDQYSDGTVWHAWLDQLTGESDLPDALFKADLYDWETIDLYNKGVLIDLTPYIESCMPSLCSLLDQYPSVKEAITIRIRDKESGLTKDIIVSLPYINETPLNCGIWINTAWLNRVGMTLDSIKTVEDFEKMLTRFKDNDPNKNGSKDEIPLAFLGSFDLKFLAHIFGLYCNNYNLSAENGQAVFMPGEEGFLEFVQWCTNLYKEGLIDPNGYSSADTLRQISSDSTTNIYGAIITTSVSSILPSSWIDQYSLMTPIAYDGSVTYRDYFGNAVCGTFAVTSACKDVEGVLKWADLFYTPEVAVLAFAGERNEEYILTDDTVSLEDFIQGDKDTGIFWNMTTDPNYVSVMQSSQLISGSTAFPGYSVDAFQRLFYSSSVTNIWHVYEELSAFDKLTSRPFPYYSLTAEQLAYISPIQNRIGYAVDLWIGKCVTGDEAPTQENYEAFMASLNAFTDASGAQLPGLNEFMVFWQEILDNLQ